MGGLHNPLRGFESFNRTLKKIKGASKISAKQPSGITIKELSDKIGISTVAINRKILDGTLLAKQFQVGKGRAKWFIDRKSADKLSKKHKSA